MADVTIPRETLERWRDIARAASPAGGVWVIASEAGAYAMLKAEQQPTPLTMDIVSDSFAAGLRNYDRNHRQHHHGAPQAGLSLSDVEGIMREFVKTLLPELINGLIDERMSEHAAPQAGLTLAEVVGVCREFALEVPKIVDEHIAAHIRTAHLPASYTVTTTKAGE